MAVNPLKNLAKELDEVLQQTITEKKNVTIRLPVDLAENYSGLKKLYEEKTGQQLDLNKVNETIFKTVVEYVEFKIEQDKPKATTKNTKKEEQQELDIK